MELGTNEKNLTCNVNQVSLVETNAYAIRKVFVRRQFGIANEANLTKRQITQIVYTKYTCSGATSFITQTPHSFTTVLQENKINSLQAHIEACDLKAILTNDLRHIKLTLHKVMVICRTKKPSTFIALAFKEMWS